MLWSRLANRVIQRSLVPGVRDTQCGFKAFTAEAARDLFRAARIDGWAFDLEILALAKRRGFAIAEVGVEWKDDSRSRVNPLKDMWQGRCREALTIRQNLKARRLQPGLAGRGLSLVACSALVRRRGRGDRWRWSRNVSAREESPSFTGQGAG